MCAVVQAVRTVILRLDRACTLAAVDLCNSWYGGNERICENSKRTTKNELTALHRGLAGGGSSCSGIKRAGETPECGENALHTITFFFSCLQSAVEGVNP